MHESVPTVSDCRTVSPTGLSVAVTESGDLTVYHLGYRLPLSAAETRLCLCLIRDGGGVCATADLRAAIGSGRPVSDAQVSVLVERINRKADAIGGRPLIHGRSHHGFALVPEA